MVPAASLFAPAGVAGRITSMDTSTESTISPLKALLRFPFQEPEWQNRFVIGTGLLWASAVVPLLPAIFAQGYALQLMRQAIEGQPLSLPAWDDWGKLGRDGLWGMVVTFVYLLPGIVVFCGGITLYMTSIFVLPFAGGLSDSGAAAGVAMMSMFGSMAVFFVSLFVSTFLFLAGLVPVPVAVARALAHDDLSAAFRFGRVWQRLWPIRLPSSQPGSSRAGCWPSLTRSSWWATIPSSLSASCPSCWRPSLSTLCSSARPCSERSIVKGLRLTPASRTTEQGLETSIAANGS
jgi:hypothetical protein